jgi:mannose-6-phosphate isomerase-like protein (cupin superfamily)
MKIVNLKDLQLRRRESPGGTFAVERLDLSAALGAAPDAPPESGGHPFAVERTRVPAGKQNWPLHSHASQWEFYLIESGNGVLVTETEETPVGPGSFFMCEPGHAHALRNPSADTELVYLVIANNALTDLIHYPRTGKWMAKPGRLCFRETLDYYAGEE